MTGSGPVRIAIAGNAGCWRSALDDGADVAPLPEDSLSRLDALVIGPGAADPYALARQALMQDVAVLYAAPFALSHWQAGALSRLSAGSGRILRLAEPFQHRPGFAFLRRLVAGREALLRPAYLRLLRLGSGTGVRIDELAIEELAVCDALLDCAPSYVAASAARAGDAADVAAVFLTMHYEGGPVVQCTVSLAEGTDARQLVAVTGERTLVFDDLGPVASLRTSTTDAEASDRQAERLLAAPVREPMAEEALRFLAAVATNDTSVTNADRWTRVAGLWWAARQSLGFEEPVAVPLPAETGPPRLRVIEGGGGGAAVARPPLTVVPAS